MATLQHLCKAFPLWTFFQVQLFLFKEGREVRRRFPSFMPYERAFKERYRFSNPFQICKKFLKKRGEENIYAYGETPLPVFATIAQECALKPEDLVLELGCGRGRGSLFLSHFVGCRVIGIDWVPFFIKTATNLVETMKPPLPVIFKCAEMQDTDFTEAMAIYLYGTCLSDEAIEALVRRFEKLSPTVKIITVSYPLSNYSPRFQTVKEFTGVFPWGNADLFLNRSSPAVEKHR